MVRSRFLRPARGVRPRAWPGWLISVAVALLTVRAAAAPAQTAPAKLTVCGAGLIENRRLASVLRQLQRERKPAVFGATFVEDAALLLLNRLQADGYLRVQIRADFVLEDGAAVEFHWREAKEILVPRDLAAKRLRFTLLKGRRFYYGRLDFLGLTQITEGRARSFFYPREGLLNLKSLRPFSHRRLASSLNNLRQALANLGFRDAAVEAIQVEPDDRTGAVTVRVRVVEGPQHWVRVLRIRTLEGTNAVAATELRTFHTAFSPLWEQDVRQELARREYARGFPEAVAQIEVDARERHDDRLWVDLVATVTRGPRVRLGRVLFEGHQHTRESLLRRKTAALGSESPAATGAAREERTRDDRATPAASDQPRRDRPGAPEAPWLNRLEVDRAREGLARLGIFRSVDVRFREAGPGTNDVVFDLSEGRRLDVSLLFGFGSYDKLFGGVEVVQNNVWGLAHFARLEALQSFKTSRGSYSYSVPEFLDRDTTLFFAARGLRREEISFTRQEASGSLGLRHEFPNTGHQVGVRYAYELLNARDAPGIAETEESSVAANVGVEWQFDRRDNSVNPRKGFHFFANAEVALPEFGGEASYARTLLGASGHARLWPDGFLHAGLAHGIAAPLGDFPGNLPFNKRFFPGGDSSVRGFEEGGASPLNAAGDQTGAEASTVWNLELEQLITPRLSVVGFLDGAGIAESMDAYPFDQVLWSVGGGLRWHTVVGPVRIEYGHNLNPRAHDPSGTIQVSLGYPF